MVRTGNSVVQNLQGQDSMKHVEPDDFIIHLRSFQGGIERSTYSGKVSTAYTVLAPKRRVVAADYLRWLLKSDGYIQELRTTTNQLRDGQSIKFRDFAKVPLPLPPLKEQRAIAVYLDRETARIDTLIEEQQRLIEMLRERRSALISAALTPTHSWLHRRIKHIGETILGKMLDAGRAVRAGDELNPYVRAADVRADGSVNLVDLNEMPFSATEMETFHLRAGDVLLIEGGATVGRPGFMFESAPGVAFQKTVNRLRVGPRADARFVYWAMLRLYESAYYANHYGAVSFVHLTGEKLREIELHLPSVDEQRVIAAHLDEQTAKIDRLIAETERFIELARERRSALITAAVTGQIDVRAVA
jgi:type I restriction enzyme S subunit